MKPLGWVRVPRDINIAFLCESHELSTMNWLRTKVSGKKHRYQENGYNLDLTYVTPRIIAMSFPAAGFETAFRNDIDSVAKLIKQRHGRDYLIFNLSGRKYDYFKFDGQVLDLPWEDHHSPPLHYLFEICSDIHKFLCKNTGKGTSAVSIHCLAGKGRTGTVICCYLMYSGTFSNADEALYYYKKKRFITGGGVTQPSQVRYVKYFATLLFGDPRPAKGLDLISIVLNGIPKIDGLKPSVKVYGVKKTKDKRDDDLLFPNKSFYGDAKKFIEIDPATKRVIFQAPPGLFLHGDILIRIYNQETFSDKVLFRFAFNTAFIENKSDDKIQKLNFNIRELDPDKIVKDSRYPAGFQVELSLNQPETTGKDQTNLVKEDQVYMDRISTILKQYQRLDPVEGKKVLFGAEPDDIEAVMCSKEEIKDDFEKIESQDIEADQDPEEEDEEIREAVDKEEAEMRVRLETEQRLAQQGQEKPQTEEQQSQEKPLS